MRRYILSETQMQQIIDSMILEYGLIDEQVEIPPDDEFDMNAIGEPEDDDDAAPAEPQFLHDPQIERVPQPKPKKKSPTDIIKERWVEENPHLTNNVMDDTIEFFNQKKNGLRVFKAQGDDPNYVNLPVISALIARFPEMHNIVTDIQKLRDIQNYTWEQMEYFMDRFGHTDGDVNIINFQIKGDTFERRLDSALEIWNKKENLVYDNNNIRAFKITGTDEAIALGRLQRVTIEKHGGMGWCSSRLVNPPPGVTSEGANMYSTYRAYSSYYYVLNKNLSTSHNWYTFVINACDMTSTAGRQRGPYMITPRENGTLEHKSWDEVCSIIGLNEFSDKQNIFRYYPLTNKEKSSAFLDQINFRKGTIDENGEEILPENHFRRQPFAIQKAYIEAGRPINDPRSFEVLPWTTSKDPAEKAKDLRMLYIKHTNSDNWHQRFLSTEDDPFGMINIIQKETPQHFRFLEWLFTDTLKFPSGTMAIKVKILQSQYVSIFIDPQKRYVCLKTRSGRIRHGVLDLNTINWVEDLNEGYVRTAVVPAVKNDGSKYIFQRFTSEDGENIFYFGFTFTNYYNPRSPSRGHGTYYTNEEVNELFNNGEYRKLGFERK